MKLAERERARMLRRENGMPINAMAAEIGVSSSSVSRWVRDVELTAEQEAALREPNPIYNRQRSGTARSSANARTRRLDAQAQGRRLAAMQDPPHAAACMLYWAEGTRSRNQLGFTNSDPDMVDLFLHFLRRCYGVSDQRIALTINVHLGNGLTLDEIEGWWLRRLSLPRSSLRRSMVNRPSRASQRKRRTLVYGTARLVVSSTELTQSCSRSDPGVRRPVSP